MGEHHVIVHKTIELFGLNLSITNFVVILWLAASWIFDKIDVAVAVD